MRIDLGGKAALVTGGSRGLGFAAAARAIAEETGRRVTGIRADVADPAQITRACAEAEADLGPIDILLNNAGGANRGAFDEVSNAQLLGDVNIKVAAALHFAQALAPGMKRRGGGRIINTVAILGKAARAGTIPTSLSRAAGISLTKILSLELAPHNILVNAIAIGFIESSQLQRDFAANAAPGQSFEDFIAPTLAGVPLGRIGRPEEFAALVTFLASDLSAYLTGAAINLDGGASPLV